MKKKIVMLLLALTVLGLGAGCNKDKDSQEKTEQTQETADSQEKSLTNEEGKVVAVDLDNLDEYMTLGQYQNLEVEEASKTQIQDEDVDTYIKRQMAFNYDPVELTEDRAVQEYDTVNIDYTGYKDGEAFEGGTDQGYDLLIGSGNFIEGFEEGLIGHNKGEEVTLDLTFPENYSSADLAGQAVQFVVKINKISEPAPLTDEWASENTDFKTAEEYRANQKELLQQQADNEYESQVKSDLFQLVMETTEVKEYPQELLEETRADLKSQLDNMYSASYGMTMDEYLESQGASKEDADQTIDETAKSYLKQNMVTQAILNAEKKEYTEEDYQEELEKFAVLSGFSDGASMEAMYSDVTVLKDNVLWNAATDIIMSTANIKEGQE